MDRSSHDRRVGSAILRRSASRSIGLVCSIIVMLAFSAPAARAADDAAGVAFFESKIRPVLVERCHECHSSQAKKLKGGLRLDTRDGDSAGRR